MTPDARIQIAAALRAAALVLGGLVPFMYHGVRDVPRGTQKKRYEAIKKGGFKTGRGRPGSLTPNSVSFFVDKSHAALFAQEGWAVIPVRVPGSLKLLDHRSQWGSFFNWWKSGEAPDQKKPETAANLKAFGGYHGVMNDLEVGGESGVEYRIHDPRMIRSLKPLEWRDVR